MPGVFNMAVDDARYRRAEESLSRRQLGRALFRTVQRGTERGVNIVQKRVRAAVVIEKKYVERVIRGKLTTREPEPPVGTIVVSHQALPAIAYKPTGPGMTPGAGGGRKRGGIRFKTWKDRPARVFRHGFVATVNRQNATAPSELHAGVFIRKRGAGRAVNKFARSGTGRGSGGGGGKGITARGIAERLPIKQLMGPSLLGVAEQPKILRGILGEVRDTMNKTLDDRIKAFTEGKVQ